MRIMRDGEVGSIDEKDVRSLWLHAVRHAVVAAVMKPSLCDVRDQETKRDTGECPTSLRM
jgi:hypothetical protein